MDTSADRLRRTVDDHTRAVQEVRKLDTEYSEDDDEATFDAKLALIGLDTALVCPRFWGLAILTYTPEAVGSAGVVAILDTLDTLDAIARAIRIVELVRREGPIAAFEATEALSRELRAWMEVGLEIPEIRASLVAYRDNPRLLNEIRHGAEAI